MRTVAAVQSTVGLLPAAGRNNRLVRRVRHDTVALSLGKTVPTQVP